MTAPVENTNDIVEAIKLIAPFLTIWFFIALFIGIWKLLKFWGSLEEKLKNTEKIQSTIRRIDENISSINWNLKVIQSRVDKVEWSYLQSFSPINLTQKWKELVDSEKIENSIINNWSNISQYIEKNCSWMNPYNIQEFLFSTAMSDLSKLMDNDWLERLKIKAYNDWVPVELLGRVVAIVVRNKYLEEKWISHEEIDKCDPTVKKSS